jgi:hypothetical protein
MNLIGDYSIVAEHNKTKTSAGTEFIILNILKNCIKIYYFFCSGYIAPEILSDEKFIFYFYLKVLIFILIDQLLVQIFIV